MKKYGEHAVKALFLNIMQFVPQFYDEKCRRRIDFKKAGKMPNFSG